MIFLYYALPIKLSFIVRSKKDISTTKEVLRSSSPVTGLYSTKSLMKMD